MNWVLELAATGTGEFAALARAWFDGDGLHVLQALPGVVHVDLYVPLATHVRDPFVAGAAGPLAMAMAHFRTNAALRTAVSRSALGRWLAAAPSGVVVTATPMTARVFAVEEPQAEPRHPRCRYVVRYHGSGEQAAGFADHYERTHPPLLAKLPRIRAIECYRPIAAPRAPHCEPADYLIGNEVEFDSACDLDAAMASPARAALRADFDALPPVFRDNTHFAMRLERHHAPS